MFTKTGYHGTLRSRVDSILKNGFIHSKKDNEWLGFGVYFFDDIEWAKVWANLESRKYKDRKKQPAVLSAYIECDENEFFDLDIKENMDKLIALTEKLISSDYNTGHPEADSSQIRCMACNFWRIKYKTKVFAYTFPRAKYNSIGFPTAAEQRQLCVADDKCIKIIELMNIKGGSDYAV